MGLWGFAGSQILNTEQILSLSSADRDYKDSCQCFTPSVVPLSGAAQAPGNRIEVAASPMTTYLSK